MSDGVLKISRFWTFNSMIYATHMKARNNLITLVLLVSPVFGAHHFCAQT